MSIEMRQRVAIAFVLCIALSINFNVEHMVQLTVMSECGA